MKPVTIILLMGVAALAGGLLVRYSAHPAVIATSTGIPPKVVAPPLAPSTPLPVASSQPVPENPVSEKPSPWAETVHVAQPKAAPIARPIRPEPSGVTTIESAHAIPRLQISEMPPPAPKPVPAPAPKPVPVPKPAPEPEPNEVTLRAGTLLTLRINEALASDRNGQGEVFTGALTQPLIADGFAIAERGAKVRGFVVDVKAAGTTHPAELTLRLREISTSDGQWVHISTSPWTKHGIAGNIELRPDSPLTFRLDQPVDIVERR